MKPEHWQQLDQLLEATLELPVEQRAAFLAEACAGDELLRQEAESLLRAEQTADRFMETPAVGLAATVLADKQERSLIGRQFGHYQILSPLGKGGMGEVYLADDTRLHRRVALKLLPAQFAADQDAGRRFLREARAAAALDHPNICTIHEIGEDNGHRFIVMQYVEGETLADRLKRSPLSMVESLSLATQIADALAEAHAHQIIHRDIKPANVIITPRGQAKVLDFGLAKFMPNEQPLDSKTETASLLSTPGLIVGTVPYMSPEQVRGERLDARTDIFSFGVVLYEMVSGRQPFAAPSMAEIFSAILTREPPSLKHYAASTPKEIERIVRKCLEKDQERRAQTMREVVLELENVPRELEREPASISTSAEASSLSSIPAGSSWNRWRGALASRTGLGITALVALLLLTLAYALFFHRSPATQQSEIRSLAVLPLKMLGQDARDDYLGMGITDAIITKTSQIGELTVRPTSAVRKYAHQEMDALEAARQLQTEAVLDGSVQRAGNRLRVSVNLLRVRDGASLWAENFDLNQSDVFAMQDSVSKEIAARLKLKLSATEAARLAKRYTTNSEAYEYYLKGQVNLERRTNSIGDLQPMEAAISSYKKAVELDPQYALAWATLGYTYMWVANFNDPDNPAWVRLFEQTMAKAEALDAQLAEIHTARFEYYFSKYGNWDLRQAAREARQALALNPSVGNYELGTLYDHLGLDEETGLRVIQRALEIDPTNINKQSRLVETYRLYGRLDQAIEAQRRFFGVPGPVHALIEKNRLDEAQTMLEKSIAKSPGDLWAKSGLALVLALKGQFSAAQAHIPEIVEKARNNRAYHHIAYDIASVYALLGNPAEAVKWLRTVAETGMPNYTLFARDPHLDRIRKEPIFTQFMAELKPRWEGYRREFE